MRVGTEDSSSASVGNEHTDEFENPDTSDDAHFWRKEPVRRFTGVSSVARSGWHMCAVFSVTAVMLLVLIITVSVSHVKFQSKFSATETNMKNLSQTLLTTVTRTKHLEEYGHKVHSDISSLEFNLQTLQGQINDMSDALQILHSKASELRCHINKMNNSTQDQCCVDGWFLFSSHCYFFSDDGMSWSSARNQCERKKAQLLVLTNKLEKEFVVSKTKPLFYWLGLTDGRTGEWEWLDRTPYVMLRSEWMPGQPDDWQAHGLGGGEDCAHFHYDGRYNDDHCTRRYRYVCKTRATSV
ncbi:putative asialoglycoprotein receptor 1-like [Triplophysa rosa]|uniref:Asialoglycoprotein receptor 1-like n=1 Tax=Triplophysa rosa TaxID=992332 RepID=A0A9W7TC96_TRIRA|nr:putative asialoglycoprotein receptor 1-like [Triplophysa rosa]